MDSQKIRNYLNRFFIKPTAAFVAVVSLSLLIGSWQLDNLREGLKRDAQHNIAAVGELKASQIRDWLDDRESDAKTLSDNSFFTRETLLWMREGAHDDARRKQLKVRLDSFLSGHHFYAIVLYDAAGRVLLSAGMPIPDSKEIGMAARQAIVSGRLQFVDLHRHPNGELPIGLGFISLLREGDVNFGATYLAEDPGRYLFPLLDSWPGGSETAETQLVRAAGDQIVYLNQMMGRDEPPLVYHLPLDTPESAAAIALRGKQGLIEHAHDYRGKAVLSYATSIKGTPWVLVSKVDEEEAYHLVDQMKRVSAFLALFIFSLIAAWFWLWRRREREAVEAPLLKERMRADTLKMEGEKRFRMVFEHTALPMVRNSLTGEFIEVNDAWCGMFGYAPEEVLSQHLTWQQVTHPDDMESGFSLVKQMLDGDIADFKIEKRYLRKDGKVLWGMVQVSLVRDAAGVPEFVISAIQDITERKQAEQQISFMAYHDKLTGLPNRSLLFDRLSQAMSQAKRDRKFVALLFVDLDGFKAINDRHGHEAGDAILKMAAQRFLACVRAVDTVSRFGGDEFAIVLGALDDPQQARSVAEKIVQAFAQGMTLPDGCECSVGASVGISIYPEHGSAMDDLMMAADHAMYDSKHGGKNTYTFFKRAASGNADMPWISLDDAHLVGVEEIDEQHYNLTYLVNRLNEALKHDESEASIMQMFDELLVATAHHFETESRFMREYHYPELAAHEQEHAHLVNEATHLKTQFSQGRELLALQSIKDWLLNHILYSDKRLALYLKQHGVR